MAVHVLSSLVLDIMRSTVSRMHGSFLIRHFIFSMEVSSMTKPSDKYNRVEK